MIEPGGPPRHRSFVGPLLLISIGVFILLWNLYPDFDPWPWLRYWPVILIVIGLGKIWDSYYARQHPDRPRSPWIAGTEVAWIILVVLLVLAFWHGRHWHNREWRDSWGERWGEMHDTQSIDLQGAKSVDVDLQFPAGRLDLRGGASQLLDADFRYDRSDEKPTVDYSVSGGHGQLKVAEPGDNIRFGPGNDGWQLRMGGDAAMDFNINIGAGESVLRLGGLNVEHLKVNMGAGRLDLDLTGPRKTNLDADVEGGVGSAMIRLPKDVGVRVNASGGIGSVSSDGLRKQGDFYENDVYGKTPASIDLTVHGGIGEIVLVEQ